jgi:hypothetical protein
MMKKFQILVRVLSSAAVQTQIPVVLIAVVKVVTVVKATAKGIQR